MRVTVERPGTLLEMLSALHEGASNRKLRLMLDTGRVRVNGAIERRAKAEVAAGDLVEIASKPTKPEPREHIKVLFEDERLLVAEKPQGLLTVATDKGGDDSLYDRAFEHVKRSTRGGRVFIVHRLDRPTSGLLVFAKDEDAKDDLQAQFAARTAERVYVALVEGTLEKPEGELETWLKESASLQVYATPDKKGGSRAALVYKVVEAGPSYSLVEIRLETGRKAQIRVQLSEAGHPLAGDPRYGARSDPLRRLGLHASSLSFEHPSTGERVTFSSPPPKSFREVLKKRIPSAE